MAACTRCTHCVKYNIAAFLFVNYSNSNNSMIHKSMWISFVFTLAEERTMYWCVFESTNQMCIRQTVKISNWKFSTAFHVIIINPWNFDYSPELRKLFNKSDFRFLYTRHLFVAIQPSFCLICITSDHMNDRNKIFNVRVMLVVWYIFECRFYLYVSPCLFFLLKVKNKRNKKKTK